MKKVERLMAIILCLSFVFFTLGFVNVSASDSIAVEGDYEPGNPSAIFEIFNDGSTNTKAAIRLSWVNPKADTLKEVKIYGDTNYGDNKFDTLITTISNPTPGAVSDYVVKKDAKNADLITNTCYTYRVVYVFEDRQTEVLLTAKASSGYNEFVLRGASNGKSKVFVNGSMLNMPGYSQSIVNDADGDYLKMSANVAVHDDLVRELKFNIGSGTISAGTYNVKITYKSDSDFNWGGLDFKKNENWTTLEKEVTTTTGGLTFNAYNVKQSFQNLCIKKLEVYNVPVDGTDAVLVDSFDCSIYSVKPQPVGNITTSLSNSELRFEIGASNSWWWNNGNDANAHVVNFYNIYEIIDGEKFLRAKLGRNEAGVTQIPVTLHNVSDGMHTYEITCSDLIGLESPSKTVSVTVMPYEPKNVTAIKKSGAGTVGINISWINPVATTLNKVSIFEVDTNAGNETLLSDAIDKTPGKTVKYTHDNLTAETVKTYRVQFDFTDHSSVEVYTSGVATLGEHKNVITNANNKQVSTYLPATTASYPGIINKVVSDGSNHYLNFRTNIEEGSGEIAPIYIMLDKSMEAGTYYTLKFKAKSEKQETFYVNVGTLEDGNNKTPNGVTIPASDAWIDVTCEIVAPWSPNSIFLVFKDTVENLYIDDVELGKKTDASDVLTAQNFENIGLKSGEAFPKKVGSAMAIPSVGTATMVIAQSASWWHSADDFNDNIARTAKRYKVYEDINGIKMLRAELIKQNLDDSIPTIKFNGLTNSKTYTYYVTCEDDMGVLESEPVVVTVTPQGSLVVSEFVLKSSNGEVATKITAGATYSVSVNVDNSTGKSTRAQLIAAVYDGNRFVEAYLSTAKSVGGSANEPFEVTNIQIPASASEEVELKCFVWNGLNSLSPLCDAKTYKK